MSKYEPLYHFLRDRQGADFPMTFSDVEKVLGFPLPPSARSYPNWWSNNAGTHVGVRAWRDAGWRTSRVDVAGQKVTFVRDSRDGDLGRAQSARNQAKEASPPSSDNIWSLTLADLTPAAREHLVQLQEDTGLDLRGAIKAVLNATGRRMMVERWSLQSPKTTSDSVELLREARGER